MHIQLARANGAEVIENCTVTKLDPIKSDECVVSNRVDDLPDFRVVRIYISIKRCVQIRTHISFFHRGKEVRRNVIGCAKKNVHAGMNLI